MALILHLSDLHLVARSASPSLDDQKVRLVPAGTRRTHFDALSLTFERLAERLISEGKQLDAVLVTGDVSDKNDQGGYESFLYLIQKLGAVYPGANRVVVVPGNHDVESGLTPMDPRLYERFLSFIRTAGFVTPLLSAVDTNLQRPSQVSKHLLCIEDIQFIPIDSAGYSQVRFDVGITDSTW